MIELSDLLENKYTRWDFDGHTYGELLNMFEYIVWRRSKEDDHFTEFYITLARNLWVIRVLLLEKLDEPGWGG